MTRSALARQLEAEGFQIAGSDKIKVLGTNLWRSRRFWNIRGAGYWPKRLDLPVGYEHLPRAG
jgi:hypothetical protein